MNVTLSPSTGGGTVVYLQKTDASGHYAFGVLPGDYRLNFSSEAAPTAAAPTVWGLQVDGLLTLTDSTRVIDIQLPFKRVSVHVQDTQNQPVAKVALLTPVLSNQSGVPIGGGLTVSGSSGYLERLSYWPVLTNDSGDATLWLLATGTGAPYTFRATPPDGSPYTTSSQSVTFTTDTSVDMVLQFLYNPPVAVDDSATTNEDNYIDIVVVSNDTDTDTPNGNLRVASGSIVNVHGGTAELQGDGRTVRFTPALNANSSNAQDGFGFNYKASDGTLASLASATVSITVTPVNDAPVADAESYATNEATVLNQPAPGVLSNDTDADGDNLTAIKVTGPAHGALMLNANGSFTYTPDSSWSGSDSFTYKANDGTADSNSATVTITVTHINHAPVTVDDAASTNENQAVTVDVLANDTDADCDALTISDVGSPAHGSVALNTANQAVYTPNNGYSGNDSFTYKASDGKVLSNPATVTITVVPINHAPVATAQSVTTVEDTPVAITLAGSDADGDKLSFTVVASPVHGSLSGTAPDLTYTPDTNYNGPDSFTFKVNDGALDSSAATVSITVTPVNDSPAANAGGTYSGNEGSPIPLDGSKSSDPDTGDTLAYAWSYSADSETTGTCSFSDTTAQKPSITCTDNGTYTVSLIVKDNHSAQSSRATATVTVSNVAPTIDSVSVGTGTDASGSTTGTACTAGKAVSLSFTFSDRGTSDSWVYDVNWGDGTAHTTAKVTSQGQTGPFTHTYAVGTYAPSVTVTDKDGGKGTWTASTGAVSYLYNMSPILDPFQSDGSSIWKAGSTIAVKVRITDCNNQPVPDLKPQVGTLLFSSADPSISVNESVSTSAADTNGIMRYDSTTGVYIYNLASKDLKDQSATYYMTVKGTDTNGIVVTSPPVVQQKFGIKK